MPAAVADSIAAEFDTMKVEALARWRRWCGDVAKGGKPPKPADILSTAALLEIRDPGPAFDADAEALVEYGHAKRLLAKCEAERDAVLAPYGGDVRQLEAAVEQAEAKAQALRDELERWNTVPGQSHYIGKIAVLQHKHPRVLGGVQ